MTTHDGDKPDKPKNKKKSKAAKPRLTELVYLREQGQSVDDAESRRSQSTLNVPTMWTGPNLGTEYGRECTRERKYFVWWLREEIAKIGDVADLAGALVRHERDLDDEDPPDTWVKIASRITRGTITDEIGRERLRAALDTARERFRNDILPHERNATEFAEGFAKAARRQAAE